VVPDFEKDSEILYIIGISLWKLQKFEEALTFLEMLIDNEDFEKLYFKKQAQVYRAAGDIYEKREDIKTAVEYYKKAVKKDSNDSETFKALGMAYLKTSDPDKEIYARYYLNLALKISPNLSDAEKVLKEINKKFVRVAFLKYMFPVLMIVIILLVLLEFSIKLKKKKDMRRLMK
jgi:tetratricopeptide (TPR) repeat protein